MSNFIKELESISVHNNIPFGRLRIFEQEEINYQEEIKKFKGYNALSMAFISIFFESIELLNSYKINDASENYLLFIHKISNSFTSLNAARITASQGYPLQGVTIIRNIFDTLIMTSYCLQEKTTFLDAEGITESTNKNPLDLNLLKKNRKKIEFNAFKAMLGETSGLSKETITALKELNDAYDLEVHGARLSFGGATKWIKGESTLSITPQYIESNHALFICRYCETAWLIHRMLPALQKNNISFSKAWKDKWIIINNVFRLFQECLSRQNKLPIGNAFIEFVEMKFPFDTNFKFKS